jgi:hypothetical protein
MGLLTRSNQTVSKPRIDISSWRICINETSDGEEGSGADSAVTFVPISSMLSVNSATSTSSPSIDDGSR